MVFKKKGLPEDGEIVICTVKKVLFHSVFVNLDEYEGLEGLVHISEIAPGRIRNIRDYVIEGKRIVCKVLIVNRERRTIDLSLRRVSLPVRLKKEDEVKQEAKAEKILESVAQKLGTTLQDAYAKVGAKIIDYYGSLTSCFHDVVANGDKVLDELRLPPDYAKELLAVIKERIKPPKVTVTGELKLESTAEDGIDRIKSALLKGEEFAKQNNYDLRITYMSAPHYLLELTSSDYKSAEQAVDKIVNVIICELSKDGGIGSFKRKE